MSVRGPALTRASAPAFSRLRLGAYVCAGLLHLGAIGAIAVLPPEALEQFIDTGTGIEIRFFTISASDAESNLPLNVPLLADRGETGSDSAGADGSPGDDASGMEEAEPEPTAEPEPEPADETSPDETVEPVPPVSETGTLPPEPDTPAASAPPAPAQDRAPVPSFSVTSPESPVDTIQPAEEDAAITIRRVPTFAGIAARAETGLRVEDFQVSRIEGSVGAVIAEVFCLSSGDANREIGDCGDGPNAAQAELAIYHIRAMSAGPLEFAENMSRLEFELAQLGVSPSTMELLRVHFLNAQREQISRSPLLRAMDRDRSTRTDHLGIGPSITPQRARDPSGER
ncbi:MAG: hypothetical protein ACXIVO_06730 [Glycocaulis sp.]